MTISSVNYIPFITTMSVRQRAWYTLLSALVLVFYLILGAFLFIAIERPYQEQNPTLKITTLEEIIENLSHLGFSINGSAGIDFADEHDSDVLIHTTDLASKLLIMEKGEHVQWRLNTAINFCLTAVTTIGYGYIVPATQLGRVICIPYILLGIPLNLFFSANLGYFIARLIVMLYSKTARDCQLVYFPWISPHQGKPTELNDQAASYGNTGPGTDYGELAVDVTKSSQRLPAQYNNAYRDDDEKRTPRTISRSEINSRPSPSRTGAMSDQPNIEHGPRIPARPVEEGMPPGKTRERNEGLDTCPMWFIVLFVSAFCALTALYMVHVVPVEWTFIDALYFVIVTFTTVGFGDMKSQATETLNRDTGWWVRIPPYVLMELGLVLMAATLTIWSDNVKLTARRAKRVIKRNCPVSKMNRDTPESRPV